MTPAPFDFLSWRKALGLTQEAAAARLGITRPYYALLESGKKQPSDTLVYLAKMLEGFYTGPAGNAMAKVMSDRHMTDKQLVKLLKSKTKD